MKQSAEEVLYFVICGEPLAAYKENVRPET